MDNINRTIYDIVNNSESNRITVFTQDLKIEGYVYKCDGKCKQVADIFLTLNDAIVCRLEDYCSCDDEECTCNDFVCFKYDWLNILHSQIVAFSIIK